MLWSAHYKVCDIIINCDYLGDNCNDDIACLLMASNDRHGLEAIKALHQQLDDDANGNVDLSESDDVSYYWHFILLTIRL